MATRAESSAVGFGSGSGSGSSGSAVAERKAAMQRILDAMHHTSNPVLDSASTQPSNGAPLNRSAAVPIMGAAWAEQIHVHTVPVSGTSILRHCVKKELDFLDRAEARGHGVDAAAVSSNAPFLESLWKCAQHYAHAEPPLTDLSVSISAGQGKKAAPPIKVDVVANGGRRWVRLFTLKPSSLLQEFRLVEADEGDASSDDSDGERGGLDDVVPTSSSGSYSRSLDSAAQRCSIVRTAWDLRRAADRLTSAQSRGQVISIDLVLTRLERPESLPEIDHEDGGVELRDLSEDERYRRRLSAILDKVANIPHLNLYTSREVPFLGPDPSTLSGPPRPTLVLRDTEQDTVRNLNLDLSALVALASDIVHGEALPPDASTEQARLRFHTSAPYKALKPDLASQRPNVHSGAHGRALGEQLWRECCQGVENGGDFLNSVIQARDGRLPQPKVVLWTTRQSADKLLDIAELVAGKNERRRAYALVGRARDVGARNDRQAFWFGSRWAANALMQERIQLPVSIIDEDPPPSLGWAGPFTSRFARDVKAILSSAIRAHAAQEVSDESAAQSGFTPTIHSLQSLLAGCEHGMTTLTTNFTSVKWLVKQRVGASETGTASGTLGAGVDARQNSSPTLPGSLGMIGDYYLSSTELARLPSPQAAVLWVLHPRSFSEQMRVNNSSDAVKGTQMEATQTPASKAIPVTRQPSNTATAPPRRRWRLHPLTWRACAQWMRGPDVPEPLVIRHYPWWPFERVEQAWLRLTAPVAWQDPYQRRHDSTSSPSRPLLATLPERGRAKARAGLRHIREGLPTWVRSPPKHSDAQIELSPSSPERERRQPDSSGDTAVEVSLDDGLRRRHVGSSPGGAPTSDLSHETRIKSAMDTTRSTAARRPHFDGDATDEGLSRDEFYASIRGDWRTNKVHWTLLFVTCACWIIAFGVLAKSLWYESSIVDTSTDADASAQAATFYGCTSTYWLRNAECGLNGQNCAPFTADAPAVFRCPQDCLGTKLGAPRAVGDQLPAWVPLVVGGGDTNKTYRGDSWVCAAAAHAGVIDDTKGGCGTLYLTGTFSSFLGTRRNGVTSESFDSTFPLSYRFGTDVTSAKCTDRRGQLYVLDVIMSAFVGFVLRPKPIVWFWILVCVGYWHVNFASEPRDYPPPVGAAFGDFLPTLFGCYAIWRLTFRFVWPHFSHLPLEREVWTLAAFWIGVLLNVVFADVPLNRLVGSDLSSQPGAITALTIIIILVIILVLNQIRVIQRTTYLPRYLTLYVVGAVIVGLLAAIPGESLRIHHYIIALVLLPGCAFPTRLSLIYSGFLLGMFENGLGRWGWDGLIQDRATVIGDGTFGTGLPTFLNSSTNWAGLTNASASASTATDLILAWAPLNTSDPSQQGFDSFNLLVDDVLRYAGTGTSFDLSSILQDFTALAANAEGGTTDGTGTGRGTAALLDALRTEPHYLRLAYASGLGSSPGDFTRAAIAYFNGTFIDAPLGAT